MNFVVTRPDKPDRVEMGYFPVRIEAELLEQFESAAREAGTNRSEAVRQLIRQYLSQLPAR